jgi:hypothetical protein
MGDGGQVRFVLRYPSDYDVPDLGALREQVEVEVTPGERDDERTSSFDSSLHSATTAMDMVTWLAGSSAGTLAVRALKDVLVEYLKQRNRSVELTVGKRKISLKGPLTKREITELLEHVLDK